MLKVLPLFLASVWRLALVVLALFVFQLVRYALAARRPRGFPPGPPTLPIIGNVHQLPLQKVFIKFHEWQKQYGPVMGVKLGPINAVVLSSYKPVRDLLDKRGNMYSSRPDNYVGSELVCPNQVHILFNPYGQAWRNLRRAAVSMMNINAVEEVLPVQQAEATVAMYDLLQTPEKWFEHIRRYSSAVILESVFGQRGTDYNSAKMKKFWDVMEDFTHILAQGATPPVDAFPILKYIPSFLTPYKARALTIRHDQQALYTSLLQETRERMRRGTNVPCFMPKLIADKEKIGLTEMQLTYVGGIMMEAGSDTTSAVLQTWMLAMVTHPEVLKKAQKELDQVCGPKNSPSREHVDQLPYMRAVMTETLRWRPIAPGGIPHRLTQDDWYDNYFLPKDTVVFFNTWSIHMDETQYDDPEEFIPERFLNNNKFGTKQGTPVDEDHRRVTYAFGAGRRQCAGVHVAENSMMINMAKMAWAFDLAPLDPRHPPDTNIATAFTDGFVVIPHPFPVRITPRSRGHKEVIEREYAEAREYLRKYED